MKNLFFFKLHQKIKSKECVVAIFGLGYVGMPLLTIGNKNIHTIGFDVSESKVNAFNKSQADLDTDTLSDLQNKNLTYATLDPKEIQKADIIVMRTNTFDPKSRSRYRIY